MPEDFGAGSDGFEDRIRTALASGRLAVDWWIGDPREGCYEVDDAYYLRPATRGDEGRVFDGSWGGICTFHGPNGCEIFEARPSGCRGLEPHSDPYKCTPRRASKQEAAAAWIPFSEVLLSVAEEARK